MAQYPHTAPPEAGGDVIVMCELVPLQSKSDKLQVSNCL